MPSSHSKTGCFTCKRRHKKCGEERPVCRSCSRLRLTCQYAGESAAENRGRNYGRAIPLAIFSLPEKSTSTISLPKTQDRLSKRYQDHVERSKDLPTWLPSSVLLSAKGFDEFFLSVTCDDLPVRGLLELPLADNERVLLMPRIFRLMDVILEHMFPYRIQGSEAFPLRALIWELTMNDRVIIAAIIGVCASRERNASSPLNWTMNCLRFESWTVSLIREFIENSKGSQDSAVFAAASLIHIIAPSRFGDPCLQILANGMASLAESGGGLQKLESGHLQFMHHLSKAAWLVSISTMESPVFANAFPRPTTFLSLPSMMYFEHADTALFSSWCCPDLLRMVQDLRILLFFRFSPGNKIECSNVFEFFYLNALLDYVDQQQCVLQAQFKTQSGLKQYLNLALILVRIEVISDRMIYPSLNIIIVNRLHAAMMTTGLKAWDNALALKVAVWIRCLLCIASQGSDQARAMEQHLLDALVELFQLPPRRWPIAWFETVKEILRSVMWHPRLNERLGIGFKNLCSL